METLLGSGHFFEGPRWHEGRWWVSDFYAHHVLSVAPDGTDVRVEAEVGHQPSGLGWLPDGSLLVVSMTDRRLLRRTPDGELVEHADLSGVATGWVNDMVVDDEGRAWVGNFGFDLFGGEYVKATLARVDPDGTVTAAADGLAFPNGSVVTPDGSTLIVGETMGSRYTAFTIAADGSLTDRRVWAKVPGVGPDGCTLDAAGRIWCADAGGNRCVLVEEGGGIVDEIAGPGGLGVYACMLGGPAGTTLAMCCAPDYDAHKRAAERQAVFVTTEVEVAGAGRP
jgi:sugar lactone lactonase YvrE